MPAWIDNWLNKLRSSLWLIPTCMTIGAILLSFTVPYLDEMFAPQGIDALWWLRNMGPEGAMTLLSTIAGSMITIAGVVFSITIVALTLASAQFGPRLLGNFLRDRGNQIVLGTFVATFLYCLLVLRTIHVAPNAYTPYWGTLVGLLLAVCSLGVLIYFMHHISVSIQAPNLIAEVSGELEKDLNRLFPEKVGEEKKREDGSEDIEPIIARLKQEGVDLKADSGGYLQAIEQTRLIEIAREENLVILLYYRPGHFVIKGTSLVKVLAEGPITTDVTRSVNQQFIFGAQRTQEQDTEFSILQLVEVAVRALSPGVNDPFTCIQCIDHLSAAVCQVLSRDFPSPYRYDEDKHLRIITPPVTFDGILNAAFHQIRQHGKGNVAIILRLLEGYARIGECVEHEENRQVVQRHVEMLFRGSRDSVQEMHDLEKIEALCRQVLALLSPQEQGNSLMMERRMDISL